MWFRNDMLGTMWSRNHRGEAETFVLWSQGGVEICLFLLDRTARMDTKKVSTCGGSFGGFKATCFQLDRAARIETTGISYFSCDRSLPNALGHATPSKNLPGLVGYSKLGEVVSTKKNTHRRKGCSWLTGRIVRMIV